MGYPVLVRPSYVLSGAAMKVAYDEKTLKEFLKRASPDTRITRQGLFRRWGWSDMLIGSQVTVRLARW